MTWYAAHLIQYFRLKEGIQTTFPVWENVVLINAQSVDEAFKEAERIGREEYGPIETEDLRLDDQPAISVFGGVRVLVECQETIATWDEAGLIEGESDNQVGHGTEVTYLEFEVDGEDALQRLIAGGTVNVTYLDSKRVRWETKDDGYSRNGT